MASVTGITVSTKSAPGFGAGSGYGRGIALILLAGLFWSITGPVIRQLEAADPWQVTAPRSAAMAATMLVFIALRQRGSLLTPIRKAGGGAVLGGLALAGAFVCYILAASLATIATTLFVLAAMPMFAAILGRLVLGEKVPQLTQIAIAIAIAGVALMVADGLRADSPGGVALALTCAFCFAVYAVMLRRQARGAAAVIAGTEGGGGADSLANGFWGGLISAAAVAAGLYATRGDSAFALPVGDIVACTLLGIVQLGCGIACFTLGAPKVPAAQAALLTLVEPVLGPVWTFLAVGEMPSVVTLVGGGIVLGAVALQATTLARGR